ncbi:MAG: MBL fold metallo-hydrolase [Planctomycetaceae bacterium]
MAKNRNSKRKTNTRADASETAPVKSRTDGVVVRMFCHGLGDCFLLSIPDGDNRQFHILIDLGIAKGSPDEDAKMADIVEQIHVLTGGTVDLLVITHEHWDHVSGFAQAHGAIEKNKLKFKHLWLAWTENPRDKLARELRQQYGKAKLALAQAVAAVKLSGNSTAMAAVRSGMDGILAFYGPGDEFGPAVRSGAKATKTRLGTEDAMNLAKDLVKRPGATGCTFLKPGEVCRLAAATPDSLAGQIKVRVLGPPRDAKAIRKLDSKTTTYPKQEHLHAVVPWSWTMAVNRMATDQISNRFESDLEMPFDPAHRIPLKQAAESSFFKDYYFDGVKPRRMNAAVYGAAVSQRRIDGDWLARGAEQLALWINSYTNNVSLVLAFELPSSKKILLFVGDAQVGNWLSWHDLKFDDEAGENAKPLTATDLLARTVLYKVGHHGSHNATLRQKGLELMTHDELVAMLPVDYEQAQRLRYGEMPLKSLIKAINETACKRLLRLDTPWDGNTPPGDWPEGMIKPRIDSKSKRNGKAAVNFIEYQVVDRYSGIKSE